MINPHQDIQHLPSTVTSSLPGRRCWVPFLNRFYKYLTPPESSTKMNPVRDYMFIENLDILVKFDDNATLLDLVGISQYLESKLNCKVDVLSENAVRKEIEPYILNDMIAV